MAKGRGQKVNKAGLAGVFGVSLVTIEAWIRNGCPVEEKGAGKGKPWVFDTASVAEWRERLVKEEAGGEGVQDEAALNRRKLLAQTLSAELALANEKGLVAPIDEFERAWARIFARIRQNVLAVPQRVSATLVGERSEQRIKEVLRAELVTALTQSTKNDASDEGEEVE
jgi:phage terminase Nu1 subunit (DNA packaging protein)